MLDASHVVTQVLDLCAVFVGQAVAGRVGNVHHRGSRFDDGFHHAGQVFVVGAPGVFGVKFYVFDVAFGIFHGGHCALNDFLAGRVELVFDVAVAGADAGVYAFALGKLQGLGGAVNVLLDGTCQGTDGGPGHGFGYLNHRVEVARARNRESGFNHIHAQRFELLGHLDFLNRVELAARHLLAVA